MRRPRVLATVVAALAISGAASAAGATVFGTVTPNPLEISSLIVTPERIDVGGRATATAQVRNLGTDTLNDVAATLAFDPVGLAVDGAATKQIGSLPGGGTTSVSWRLCGVAAGTYVVVAQAATGRFTAESSGRLITVEDTEGTCVVETSTPGCIGGTGTLATNAGASFVFGAEYRAGHPAPTGGVAFTDRAAAKTLVSIKLTSLVIAGTHASSVIRWRSISSSS